MMADRTDPHSAQAAARSRRLLLIQSSSPFVPVDTIAVSASQTGGVADDGFSIDDAPAVKREAEAQNKKAPRFLGRLSLSMR